MKKNRMPGRLHTSACDLLGCEYPVVLAGMGGVSRSELVASVSNAGGYGFLGMVREPAELIEAEIRQVREKTEREFGVNLIPAATDPELLQRQINVCIEERIASICLFWDVYPEVIKQFRNAGVLIVHQVGSVADAQAAQAAGVHMLIVQGIEAGGHVRGSLPLRKLLPEVLAVAEVPVLAAGGMVDGHDLAEMLQAGAHGVVAGTAFLATDESFAHDYHKHRIVAAEPDETLLTNLFHINWPFGALTRVLPNSVTRMAGINETDLHDRKKIIGEGAGRPLYLYSTDSPLRSTTGNLEAMAIYAGCGASRINAIVPAAARLGKMVHDAQEVIQGDAGIRNDHQLDKITDTIDQDKELLELLKQLLAAERAGARVALRSMLECEDEPNRNLFRSIYQDEVRWCRMLTGWLFRLGQEPPFVIGEFYHKAMAITGIEERIVFLNKGQAWVAKKLKAMLPGIDLVPLQEDLHDMQLNHAANIVLANNRLNAA